MGGAASQSPLATIEGLKILEGDGNAFDAAVKMSSILTVVLPNKSSVGGDGFILATDRDSHLIAYNGSGKSPRNMSVEEFLTKKPERGPLTVTVPGVTIHQIDPPPTQVDSTQGVIKKIVMEGKLASART